jgi:hypothetical protein
MLIKNNTYFTQNDLDECFRSRFDYKPTVIKKYRLIVILDNNMEPSALLKKRSVSVLKL